METPTIDGLTANLHSLADRAEAAGDFDSAVQAIESMGRLHGFYVQRRVVSHEGLTVEAAIALLSDGEPLFEAALRRLLSAQSKQSNPPPYRDHCKCHIAGMTF